MNSCRLEKQTAHAARTGQWSEFSRRHAADCPVCRDVAWVGALLIQEAGNSGAAPALPDPHALWLRAQLESRRKRTARATWPITWMQGAALIAAVAGAGLLLPREALLKSLRTGIPLPGLGWLEAPSGLVLAGAGLALLVMAGLALGALWERPLQSRSRGSASR